MTGKPDDPRGHFVAKVSRLQRDRNLSDEVLAARAGLDSAELKAILRCEDEVALDAVFLLAGALGVEPGELLDGISWVPREEGGGEYRAEDRKPD